MKYSENILKLCYKIHWIVIYISIKTSILFFIFNKIFQIPQFSRFPYLAPTIPVTNQQPHPQLSLVSAPGGRLSGQQVQNNSVTSPHAVHNPAAIHPQQLIYLVKFIIYL